VGKWGTILRTTDGGRNWNLRNPDTTLVNFTAVTFIDNNTGIVVGEGGAIYKTTDGGLTWTQKPSRTDYTLNAVSFGSATTGAIVGQGGLGNVSGAVFMTSDGGESWRRFVPPPMGAFKALYDVSFAGPTTATAVGRSKTIARTTDGGVTWFTQSSDPDPIALNYGSVVYSDPLNGWIGGPEGEILHTTDGGQTWVAQTSGESGQIGGLEFFDSLYGLARAPDQKLLKTTNGGLAWTAIQLDSLHYGGALSMISTDSVVTVGPYGYLAGSTDGGLNWLALQWGTFTLETFSDIGAFNPSLWITSTYTGKVFRTTDSGGTWATVYENVDEQFYNLSVADSSTAFAVGSVTTRGLIKRTTDAGLTWFTQASGTDETLWDIDFVSTNTGTAVGVGGTILRTTDGGNAWESQTSSTTSTLLGVSFVSPFTGFAVGRSGVILRTTDGGVNWTMLSSGTTQNLFDVWFTDSATGTAVGYGRAVLRTTDGGTTWVEQFGGGLDSEGFIGVEFFDTNFGMITGDSTVLRTTNGGSTWVNEFIGTLGGPNSMALNIGGYDYVVGGDGLIMRRFREDYGSGSPVVSDIPSQSIDLGGRFTPIRVDNFVSDPNDPDSLITWTWSGNVSLRVTWNPTRRRIAVRPPSGWTGSETITFTGTDPGGLSDSDAATFKVSESDGATMLSSTLGEEEDAETVPDNMFLAQNHPNPFNPSTSISFVVPVGTRHAVSLQVFDVLGREVATLAEGMQEPGYKSVEWDATDMPSGVYFYRLSTPGFVQTRKLILLR